MAISLLLGCYLAHSSVPYLPLTQLSGNLEYEGELAQMVERLLSMREVPGSIPGFSIFS